MIRTFARATFIVGSVWASGIAWMGFAHYADISANTASQIWLPLGLFIGVGALYMVTRDGKRRE